MKKYEYENGSHRFDENNKYLGWYDKYGLKDKRPGEPFDRWKEWDEEKHRFLIQDLGFKLVETE